MPSEYQPKNIGTLLEEINSGGVCLPAIQRKYVWSEEQITRLFDSLMRGYPIGTFVFWKISAKEEKAFGRNYTFYKFIQNYDERKSENEKAGYPICKKRESFVAVLDGQQRLTSLYIGLYGSLTKRRKYYSAKSVNAYTTKELYLNLEKDIEKKIIETESDDDVKYEFKFLSKEETEREGQKWYLVKEIFNEGNTAEQARKNIFKKFPQSGNVDNASHANALLNSLWDVICNEDIQLINYYEIKNANSINDILDIFVRVNSGGEVLTKSDLLFSTIISCWDDGREQVDKLINTINSMKKEYRVNIDFVMRSCLYLMDLKFDMKVESFNQESVGKVRDNWGKIADAFCKVFDCLNKLGFSKENILSYNAIIPVIYYVYKGGRVNGKVMEEIKKYLFSVQLKGLFGGAGTATLQNTRKTVRKIIENKEDFSWKAFSATKSGRNEFFRVTNDDLDALMEKEKGDIYTILALSLLYDANRLGEYNWHVDHMHPSAGFDTRRLKACGLEDNGEKWRSERNKLPNLQLLEGAENISKNDMPLAEWLKDPGNAARAKYMPDCSVELKDFDEFFEKRRELMKARLKEILL